MIDPKKEGSLDAKTIENTTFTVDPSSKMTLTKDLAKQEKGPTPIGEPQISTPSKRSML